MGLGAHFLYVGNCEFIKVVKVAKLDEIIKSALKVLGLELVGVDMHTQTSRKVLRIYIDKQDGGVSIDDCELASRQIGAVLDVEDPFSGGYNLEVSSPGLDRPLFTQEHYEKYIGSRVKIRLRLPLDGRRNFVGDIKAVQGDNITIVVGDDTFELAFSNIEKANLVPEI